MNEMAITQPVGLRAFGWGFLGFIGSNVIINVICTIAFMLAIKIGNPFLVLVLVFGGFAAALWAAYVFADTRDYRATSTGVYVSMALQSMVFVFNIIDEVAA